MNAWCACVALVAALAPAAASAQGVLRRPEGPPMQAGVLTTVPSKAAGSYGVAVRVFAPSRARFSAGAPVVVHVAGGVQAGGPNGRPDMQAHGFVEVFFGFPTDGGYDCRGPRSIRALADVIRFASGRASDVRGNSIADLTAPIKPLAQNCGLLGSSNGGNASIMAMALHGSEFADLAFYVSMESPIGEGAVAAELGGFGSPVNPAYDPASGRLDVGRLAWADDLPIGSFPRTGASGLKGALYFDMDGNGRHDPIADYPANAMVADIGGGTRAWYSPRLLREAERRSLLPRPRPTHVPT
ncbi:MAG: hypothetical protein FJX72_21500, partial [Armatimonadetes bacterium]|nr:hypothetical protein [Armatimonadota bacterium]